MKFSDIPQFTPTGEWQCDFDIASLVNRIDKWQKEENLELNPDFQRGHVWTEEQQIKYLEFILRGGKTARIIYLNNKQWNTLQTPKKGEFVCVDGLQRITACRRFLNNEIKVFGHYFDEFEDRQKFLRMHFDFKININNLQTKEEVLQWYLDFNSGGTVHNQEELDRVQKLLELEKTKNGN